MGHRNNPFTGHMIDIQIDQQAQARSQPEPCIFYGPIPNFPQPNNVHHSVVPAGNHCNFNFHHMSQERHDGAMYYGAPRQHPGPNLDLAIATPSGHYNPYLAPPFAIRDVPTQQPNHGGIVGGSFKRKNALAGPSSSVPSLSESDGITFVQPESAVVGRNYSHLMQGGFVAPPPVVGLPGGNLWPEFHYGANNGDAGSVGWSHAPVHFVPHAVDMSASGVNNRNPNGFMLPLFGQGHHPNPHHHHQQPPSMQAARGYNNVNLPSSQVAAPSAPSRRMNSLNSGINHHQFQDVADVRPTFVAPSHVPPTGFRLFRPQQREIIFDSSPRTLTSPFLRMLPEDEVAILEFPGYHQVVGGPSDQHRDMRLDIDHMSYEELLALEERIGCVGTGLPEGFIRNYLKIRTFTSSPARLSLEGQTCQNQQINFCVICQTDYEDKDKIGTVDCGHEYHKECIKKWLLLKNTCPVCKSTALGRKAKGL